MPDTQDLLAIAALSIVLTVLLLRARSKRSPRHEDDDYTHWI
ncbi:MAG: hypothetical protein V4594_01595 [Bacteroidota bacterium]